MRLICEVFVFLIAVGVVIGRPNASSRVLGGRNAAYGELPYQVSLQYLETGFHFAGGALINARWVVSTAKGLVGRLHNSINIILGTNRIEASMPVRLSNEIRIHALYDQLTQTNDIGLVRSATVIVFSVTIAPIQMSPVFITDGVVAQVSGWGAIHANKTGETSILQVADVTTGPCVNTEFITYNLANHFCAGASVNNTERLVGICTTDVGSPLVLNNMLIGIPFHHDPRACGNYLDGYLRITSYRAWIIGNTAV